MNLLASILLLVVTGTLSAQTCRGFDLQHEYDIPANCSGMAMTMLRDITDKPFLYVASKEAGLKIFNVASKPVLTKTIPVAALHSLHVMNVFQRGHFVYLALGNHFGTANQSPGFAIVDVSDPPKAFVVSVWHDDKLKGGAGIVQFHNDHVYLGAMKNGLMIFDASNKKRVTRLSSIIPDIHFPDRRADQSKINARGIDVRKDLVYLTYDAGGLRIIDVSNKKRPIEIGRFSNPIMNGKPRAYNNVIVEGRLAFIAVDYCGVEVLDISNPARISLVSWWNPWKCQTSGWNWFKSPGHANELAYDRQNRLLFVSTGKSDLYVLDLSNPASPQICANYGGVGNDIGTWGVSIHNQHVQLSYICTLGIPFKSRWSGVKVLTYSVP